MNGRTHVAILGGGLAGLSLALQLARRRPDTAITVIEERSRPAPERTSTVGESFSEIGAHYLRDLVGLADHLDREQLPKFGLRFFVGDAVDLADRSEIGVLNTKNCEWDDGRFVGLPMRTHQVDRARLENELVERCRSLGVRVCDGTRVQDVALGGERHRLTLSGQHGGVLEARWVVLAGGPRPPALATPRRSLGHRTRSAWYRAIGDLDVGRWSSNPAYTQQTLPGLRRLSTTHMMGRGYWTWIIPLPSGVTSVGVVADPTAVDFEPRSYDELIRWIRVRDPRLADELTATEPVPGDYHYAEVEASVANRCFSPQRWAVVGQAAAFADVLYSPGTDLIALGNTLLADLIERDADNGRIDGACALADRIFSGFAEGLGEIYRGQYQNFGSFDFVSTKVVWDSALYFGFNLLLFRHGLFGNPRFLSSIGPELTSVRSLQARVQGRLRRGAFAPLFPDHDGTVEWGAVDFMMDAYFGAQEQPDERAVRARLQTVLGELERVARRIEGVG